MKTILISIAAVLILIVLVIFLPVYNGTVRCGIREGTCYKEKINLIEYIKYNNRPGLVKECPDKMILNKMPSARYSKIPPSYFIKDGTRKEIQEFDHEWIRVNCTIPVQEVY